MQLSFLGAAKQVTGSNYLIEVEGFKILIDCGMFQGNEENEKLNFKPFSFEPSTIDALILTHAHIDHSGRIPKLVKDGFRGKIITTRATMDLCEVMLKDSAKIQESDAEWENKKRHRAGSALIEPLYTMEDAENSLNYFEGYLYGQKIDINENVSIIFRDAGHILGSTILEMWVRENSTETKLVFSGDLGMPDRPILANTEYIESADYLILESTYGDTVHPPIKESTKELIEIINKTAQRGGTVLIPAFAVGRTQELIYELNSYYEYEKIPEYMKIPIYIDSPMAINATEVFQKNSGVFNKETKDLIIKGDNPFSFENLHYVRSQEESMMLNKSNFPKIIISASGMATAGRIRHHLKHNLWNPANSLVFVGYQAEGTLGRILLDGTKKVKLLGEELRVELEIYDLEGFSGHADSPTLLNWVSHFKKKPKKVFIIHGEEEPAKALASSIKEKFNLETVIPELGNSYTIKLEEFKVEKENLIEPKKLREEIAKELESVYDNFNALEQRKNEFLNDKALEKNYDMIKNRLLELQNQLMDLNILVGK